MKYPTIMTKITVSVFLVLAWLIARLIMMLQLVLYHPLFNPFIYGLKMKEISKHLKRLFCPAKII